MGDLSVVREPLTHRILRVLPGREGPWIALWSVLVAVRPLVYFGASAFLAGSLRPLARVPSALPESLVLGYMTAVALWGVGKLGDDARAIVPSIEEVLPEGRGGHGELMRGVGDTVGPVILTTALTVFYSVYFTRQFLPPAAAAITVPFTFLTLLPVMNEFWVLIVILVTFYRLGTLHLELDKHFANPSLGLALVGILAFSGFWIFFATVAPFLLTNIDSPVDLVVGALFAVVPVVLLFISLYRLHKQMVDARVRYVTWARSLYRDVLASVRNDDDSVSALAEKPAVVTAAEAVVKRAEATQEWPFTDRQAGIMLGILGSVLASLAGRLVLSGVGL